MDQTVEDMINQISTFGANYDQLNLRDPCSKYYTTITQLLESKYEPIHSDFVFSGEL